MTAGIACAEGEEIEVHVPLRLGDVGVGAVVFHPYWRVGRVVSLVEFGAWVAFMPEFDYRTRVLVREGKLALLGYNERIAAWTV